MKRLAMLAVLVSGVMLAGSASTAKADHLGGFGYGGGWASDNGYCNHYHTPGYGFVGMSNGFVPNYYGAYGINSYQMFPNYGSTVYLGTPRFSVGFSTGNVGVYRPYRHYHNYGYGYGW